MKKERILIYTEKHKMAELENSVETVRDEAGRLLNTFHAFQPFLKITTQEMFIKLVKDPQGLYNSTLQNNSGINIAMTGGLKPEAQMVAKLLGLDYENYLAIITGKKVSDNCKPCNAKAKIITGTACLSYATYSKYEKYLIWNGETFDINETEVDLKKESFSYYAETPAQIECYHFWHNACSTLNELSQRGLLGNLNEFSKTLNGKISFSYQTNKLSVDEQSLLQEIQSLKN